MAKIRLILADDHAVVRSGIRMLLEAQPDIEIVSEAESGRQAVDQVRRLKPDVVLMDVQMPELNGIEATQQIKEMAPEKAIIISTHILEEVDAVCSRAMIIDRGHIVADGTPDELVSRSRFHNAVTVVVGADHADEIRGAVNGLAGLGSIEEAAVGAQIKLTVFPKNPDDILVDDISELLNKNNWDVRALYAEAGRLDQVFRSLTTADTAEEDEAEKAPSTEEAMEASFE